jgi:hypothetical protein
MTTSMNWRYLGQSIVSVCQFGSKTLRYHSLKNFSVTYVYIFFHKSFHQMLFVRFLSRLVTCPAHDVGDVRPYKWCKALCACIVVDTHPRWLIWLFFAVLTFQKHQVALHLVRRCVPRFGPVTRSWRNQRIVLGKYFDDSIWQTPQNARRVNKIKNFFHHLKLLVTDFKMFS